MTLNKSNRGEFSELVQRYGGQDDVPLPLCDVANVDEFDAALRDWRNAQMASIALRDIEDSVPLVETLAAVTRVAEHSLDVALTFHQQQLEARFGKCVSETSAPVRFVVLGMGKLGGGELNFSSDIDIICLYDLPGATVGPKQLAAEEFFSKLIRAASKTLTTVTDKGFVFRVDLRLRPFGSAGPLAMHFDQAESYYETHGRDWERYAFIKARPVAGDIAAGEEFLSLLKPFIYRRYLDFTALHGLRDLKAKISKQYATKRLDANVKLGPGGIREIEFIAQSYQLVRGGQCEALQTTSLYEALNAAADLGLLEEVNRAALVSAYEFLRTVENRLQQRRDQQVHHLPEATEEQALLAEVLGFSCWDEFRLTLDKHRRIVGEQFGYVLVVEDEAGLELDARVSRAFEPLEAGSAYQQVSDRAQDYVEHIKTQLSQLDISSDSLSFAVRLVECVLKRSTYLAWLAEQPGALKRLLYFVDRSGWMAEQVLAQPALMDELVDDRALKSLPEASQLDALLAQQLDRVGDGDLELAMDVCRRFKASQQFLIAAADVAGYLPVMKVSDHLTALAEVLLQRALDWVAADLQQKTGRPQLEVDGERIAAQMVVIGYGKLGGLELGYGSDLDIVLLHDGGGKALGTDGERSLENGVYFQRLGQRYVHFLSANTPAGRLYEIDTRLRPSGNSGLLVTSLQAYEKYQRESAWTWEHQALVRARAVAGPDSLKTRFENLRLSLLCLERDEFELKRDVIEMRDKMRAHLDNSTAEQSNLKHASGGLVDIEFVCQYLVLRYASGSCSMFEITDNVRQLESLAAAGVLRIDQAKSLTEAYVAIRGATHHERLGCAYPEVEKSLASYRQQVVAIWKELLE